MPQNSIFPHSPFGLSSSYSRDDIQIDGMKVKFDKVADLVPAELTRTDQTEAQRSFPEEKNRP